MFLVLLGVTQLLLSAEREDSNLVHLAREEPVEWQITEAEEELLAATEKGHQAKLNGTAIRAEVIVWLCTSNAASRHIDRKGIKIHGAKITGILDLERVKLSFPMEFSSCSFDEDINLAYAEIPSLTFVETHSRSIFAQKIKVTGDLGLWGHSSKGVILLYGAIVGGHLICNDSTFDNDVGDLGTEAFDADWINVSHSVVFQDSEVVGEATFFGADIGHTFQWNRIKNTEKLNLDLRLAKALILWDDDSSWPKSGYLRLDAFQYEAISRDAPRDGRRIEWLRLQPNGQFSTQPYTQLAQVLRNTGRDEVAMEVLIAKEQDRVDRTDVGWTDWSWHVFSGALVGYGYRPWRSLWFIVGFVVTGAVVFGRASKRNLLTATSNTPDKFSAVMYSLDAFVPLVNFYQLKSWLPNAESGNVLHRRSGLRSGELVRVYFWIHIVAGWVLSTFLALALSGIIRA